MEHAESPTDRGSEKLEEVEYGERSDVAHSSKNSRLCGACRSTIHIDAKKCPNCGSFQDWRRHIILSNTLFALLVALISVGGVFGPTIVELFRPIESNLKMNVVEVSDDSLLP